VSPQARVGAATLLGLVLIVVTLTLLRGGLALRQRGYELTVRFGDAAGLNEGTPVRMAGVAVGQVRAITLVENKANVTVAMRPDVRVPQGSHFLIATTGFLGDRYLSITPGPINAPPIPEGTVVQGDEPFSLEGLEKRAVELGDRLEVLIENLNRFAGDPKVQANLKQILQNANEITTTIGRTALVFEQTVHGIQRLVDVDAAAAATDLRHVAQRLAEASDQMQAFLQATTGDGELSRNVRATAASAREASERIARMAADLQGLINSENVGKARETIADAREIARDVRAAAHRASGIIERVDRLVPSDLPSPSSFVRLDYEVWYAGQRAGHGLDVTLFPIAPRFYQLGLHDIGMTNGFVLQIGQRLNDSLAVRAGIFESQVGVGLDYRVGEPFWVNLDVYNLNQLTFDALGRYQVAPNWRIALGGKNLFRQPVIFFGVGATY